MLEEPRSVNYTLTSLDASIIIPTKNEAKNIDRCLRGIFSQNTEHQFEVIIIDTGSTDETIDIVSGYDIRLKRISPRGFRHSKVRNFGAKISKGEYLIFISGDAYPANTHWVDSLLSNFTTDTIAGVFGKQIPFPDADPIVQRQLSIYYGDTRRINKKYDRMSFQTFFFSNVNSAIRKEIWQMHPLDEDYIYCEEIEWATWAILNGYQSIYDPSAAVYHSHNCPLRLALKRRYLDGRAHKRIFRDTYRLGNTLGNSSTLRTFIRTANPMKDVAVLRKRYAERSFVREILHVFIYRAIQSIGYLLGYLDLPISETYLMYEKFK